MIDNTGPGFLNMPKLAKEWQRPAILESIFDQLSDALVIYDKNRVIVGVNQAAEKLFGMTSEALVGRECQEVFRCGECDPGCGVLVESATP